MALNIKVSQSMREANLIAYAGMLSYLDIYDGTRPASTSEVLSGQTLLARWVADSVSVPYTSLLDASTSVSIEWGTATALVSGAGSWFRCHTGNPDDAFQVALDGSVGTTTSHDLSFNSTSFVAGSIYRITSFPLVMQNGLFTSSSTLSYGLPAYGAVEVFAERVAFLRLYDGTQPLDPDVAVTTQNLLIQFPTTQTGGVTQISLGSAFATITGVATWFRLIDASGAALMDGTVGLNDPFDGTTYDFMLTSVSFVATQLYDDVIFANFTLAEQYP